ENRRCPWNEELQVKSASLRGFAAWIAGIHQLAVTEDSACRPFDPFRLTLGANEDGLDAESGLQLVAIDRSPWYARGHASTLVFPRKNLPELQSAVIQPHTWVSARHPAKPRLEPLELRDGLAIQLSVFKPNQEPVVWRGHKVRNGIGARG